MQYDFTFRSRRSNLITSNGMVASSHPLASLVGLDTLRAGGTAADAAVAMAATLGVVEPFSSGVGGDCFALYWDAVTHQVHALNASGPAARLSSLEDLVRAGNSQYPLWNGQAVSVPGAVAGWQTLLNRFGRMGLPDVLKPAIRYAEEGYAVTEYIAHGWSTMPAKLLRGDPAAEQEKPLHQRLGGPRQPSGGEFLVDGQAPRVGEIMRLPSLAATLRGIAEVGAGFIYQGQFASDLCAHVQRYGGWLQPEDLSAYQPEWVEPIFADYRGYRLYECPPNGQGLAAIMAARIAEGFDLAGMSLIDRTHTLVECMRLGFAEALAWVCDPHYQKIPDDQLFSEAYIDSRRRMIDPSHAMVHVQTGLISTGEDTTYLSVIDGEGNACSFINSLYYGGGTGLVVPGTGVLLQNRAATFSLDPSHPNVLEGGKRPYQTIIPAMITRQDELFASLGVMGGFMQPQGHLQMLVNLVDLGYNPQQALDMPRFCLSVLGGGMGAQDPGGALLLEEGFDLADVAELITRGHQVTSVSGYERVRFGGGQIILRDPGSGVLTGGSEPRKDGCALGY